MADDYKHGEMDITAQEKTYDGFVTFTVRTVIVILAVLVFLALFAS
ncbi:aa3-type cytochrome c oxidase subunit IV [Aestuariibius sp. 2305UL40-4]